MCAWVGATLRQGSWNGSDVVGLRAATLGGHRHAYLDDLYETLHTGDEADTTPDSGAGGPDGLVRLAQDRDDVARPGLDAAG